jgi:hypothetical protein
MKQNTGFTETSLTFKTKYCLPYADFHETQKFSAVLHADTVQRISPKWNNKCKNCGQKPIYATQVPLTVFVSKL